MVSCQGRCTAILRDKKHSRANRYEGTRIGTGMFDSLRRNLAREGLLERATLYYINSCAWSRLARKHNMETARRCRYVNGYDFLGGIDCHWHRVGYPCGVLNEFYELKPGDTEADILRYNGESVLLMGWEQSRNIATGTAIDIPLFASIYGVHKQSGRLSWALLDETGRPVATGTRDVPEIPTGCTTPLPSAHILFPDLTNPALLTLEVSLETPERQLRNSRSFWCWPAAIQPETSATIVVDALKPGTLARLKAGAPIVLLGPGPFAALPTSFQPSCAGRANGNLATVIADHPLLNRFPNNGWCDWQFAPLLEGGSAVVFNQLDAPFLPMLEVVSSFKTIRKQGAIFEYNVGDGRLLVCTLNLPEDDPAAQWLKAALAKYAASAQFRPKDTLPEHVLDDLCEAATTQTVATGTDQGFDERAQVTRRREMPLG